MMRLDETGKVVDDDLAKVRDLRADSSRRFDAASRHLDN